MRYYINEHYHRNGVGSKIRHEWLYDTLTDAPPPLPGSLFAFQPYSRHWVDKYKTTHQITTMDDAYLVNVVKMVCEMARSQRMLWTGFLFANQDYARLNLIKSLTTDQILHANLPCWKALKKEIANRQLVGVLMNEEVWF